MTASTQGPQESVANGRWHALDANSVLRELATREKRLTGGEAASRLERHGPNRLPPPRPRSAWSRLLAQLHDMLIDLLLGAAAITSARGHWVEAGVIFGVTVTRG